MQSTDVTVTSRGQRLSAVEAEAQQLVRVAPAAYAPIARLGRDVKPWVARRRVAEARLLCLPHRFSKSSRFLLSGESALVALGLETWWNNPDVHVRRPRPRNRTMAFEAVRLPKTTVGRVNVLEMKLVTGEGDLLPAQPSVWGVGSAGAVAGLQVADPATVVLDLWRGCHRLQSFHDTSVLIRHLAEFDRRDLEASRARETDTKVLLSETLGQLRNVRGSAGAKALVAAADAGIESPGESTVLWTLRCILPRRVQVETQYMEKSGGSVFYMDIALPEVRVAIEVTGVSKFGETESDARRVGVSFVKRQQLLTDSGWQFIHVTYDQAKNLRGLVSYLQEKLAAHGVICRPPAGRLWAPATPLLFHASRKY